MKIYNGECANGIYHLEYNDQESVLINGTLASMAELQSIVSDNKFILQQRVEQTHALAYLYPHSLNTLRIVTVYNRETSQIDLLTAVMRIGADYHRVDNWAAGGLIVGVDTNTGCLTKYGFYKPTIKVEKCTHHPNTHVEFIGYKIPYFEDAVAACKRFHSYFPDIHSVGWDVAITDDGPCFIEGNDNWDTVLPQVCTRGLKDEFDKYFVK